MDTTATSVTIVTPHVSTVRHFYDKYFDTWYPFDCGWYVLIRLGRTLGAPEIGFMEPREGAIRFQGGVMLNLLVNDVDDMYDRMSQADEKIAIPLADNPWGDRGFGVLDPAGVVVYCHMAITPSREFSQFIQKSPHAQRGS